MSSREEIHYSVAVSFVITAILCIAGYAVFQLIASGHSKELFMGIVGISLFSLLWHLIYLVVLKTEETLDEDSNHTV